MITLTKFKYFLKYTGQEALITRSPHPNMCVCASGEGIYRTSPKGNEFGTFLLPLMLTSQ